MPLQEWLEYQFRKYPVWKDEEDLQQSARDIIETITYNNEQKVAYYEHLESGKSKESYLAKKIEEGAKAANIVQVGQYASAIDQSLREANIVLNQALLTNSGAVNMNPNLHGFVAEQHHVNTFNLDAVAKGSSLRAEMRQSNNANSVDIVIKEGNKIVKRYQVKYGQNAEDTAKYFKDGTYPGQGKVVPAGQEGKVSNSSSRIEAGDVRSKELTYEEAQKIKEAAQIKKKSKITNGTISIKWLLQKALQSKRDTL
jgi:hypothetical protein